MNNLVQGNPLRTRADVEKAAVQLLEPLKNKLSAGRAVLHLGDSGAVYPENVADMEAYARPLWAIVPMLMGESPLVAPFWAEWREGLLNGTDPNHPEYWGEIGPFDQRMVEMAVMGMGLMFLPEAFFFSFPPHVRENIHRWLNQINRHDIPQNNWRFFRVLVNTGFRLTHQPFDQSRLDEDLALIEEHYEGDGWYYDYMNQRDYYTPWAFHYYGLLYAKAMRTLDPERSERYLKRAALFAPRFACWFTADGEALPYGRSLAYRFAQASFFSAMALAEVTMPEMSWGQMKGLLLRNMRKWFTRPIFTQEGVLSIGYGYPSLLMAEGYNAPGSPYWAMKAFAVLALPEDHPFWTSEEEPFSAPKQFLEPHARMLITRDEDGQHVQAFPAGNFARGHAHDEAKYEKFAYSSAFAFSVPKGVALLHRGAFDSMLVLSMDGTFWHPRYCAEEATVQEDRVLSVWQPFPDVRIETEICPLQGEWHLRTHRITTPRPLQAAEAAYAIRRECGSQQPETIANGMRCAVIAPWGTSGIVGLNGYREAEIVLPEPNTNLMYPRTLLPMLHASIPEGETVLVCAVLGTLDPTSAKWNMNLEEVYANEWLGR